jgi:hypothetical protein
MSEVGAADTPDDVNDAGPVARTYGSLSDRVQRCRRTGYARHALRHPRAHPCQQQSHQRQCVPSLPIPAVPPANIFHSGSAHASPQPPPPPTNTNCAPSPHAPLYSHLRRILPPAPTTRLSRLRRGSTEAAAWRCWSNVAAPWGRGERRGLGTALGSMSCS